MLCNQKAVFFSWLPFLRKQVFAQPHSRDGWAHQCPQGSRATRRPCICHPKPTTGPGTPTWVRPSLIFSFLVTCASPKVGEHLREDAEHRRAVPHPAASTPLPYVRASSRLDAAGQSGRSLLVTWKSPRRVPWGGEVLCGRCGFCRCGRAGWMGAAWASGFARFQRDAVWRRAVAARFPRPRMPRAWAEAPIVRLFPLPPALPPSGVRRSLSRRPAAAVRGRPSEGPRNRGAVTPAALALRQRPYRALSW